MVFLPETSVLPLRGKQFHDPQHGPQHMERHLDGRTLKIVNNFIVLIQRVEPVSVFPVDKVGLGKLVQMEA